MENGNRDSDSGDYRTEDRPVSEDPPADEHPHEDAPAKHSTGESESDDKDSFVEETSRDSYPGSDAPAW